MKIFTPVVERLSTEISLGLNLQLMEIKEILQHEDGRISIHPVKKEDVVLEVGQYFLNKWKPVNGDFYVIYPNGLEGTISKEVLFALFPALTQKP